ncbi:peroxisome biogenesis factor 1 isoform X1 [Schistocerca cancellata]|uniref:peroxisome biogenesis factor 1 isoform X1 n=2 Tax=Schistocerca cancellata TaxID=274614 RepID=UPI0021198B57|nr:peroxisome biogenesis factor 1 isoform X1 [Schistocerca cancellata]
MIHGQSFIVKLNSSRNCFLHFSAYWLRLLNASKAAVGGLKMEYGNEQVAFVSWSPYADSSIEQNEVSVSSVFAQKLGLKNEDTVLISYFPNVAAVSKVCVSPLSSEDWDLLESNSVKLQSTLLNQIRIVFQNELFVAWVSKNVHISLRIDSLEPSYEVGYVENFTEVIVNDIPSQSLSSQVQETLPSLGSSSGISSVPEVEDNSESGTAHFRPATTLWNSVRKLGSFLQASAAEEEVIDVPLKNSINNSKIQKSIVYKDDQTYLYRLQLLQCSVDLVETNYQDELFFQPYNVFVYETDFPRTDSVHPESVICKLSVVPFQQKVVKEYANLSLPVEENKRGTKITSRNCLFVRLVCLECVMRNASESIRTRVIKTALKTIHRPLFVSEIVMHTLNVLPGSRTTLEMLPVDNSSHVTEIHLSAIDSVEESDESAPKLFQTFVQKYSKKHGILLNSETLFPLSAIMPKKTVLVKIIPDTLEYCILNSESMKKCAVKVTEFCERTPETEKDDESKLLSKSNRIFAEWQRDILNEGLTTLEVGLHLGSSLPPEMWPNLILQNILIVGKSGSGRSTIAKMLCNEVKESPYYIHVVELYCKHLRGKTVETVQRILLTALTECVYYQPSVLLLDDLDAIASAVQLEHTEHTYYDRVAEMFCITLLDFQKYNYVAVIATALELGKLNPAISEPEGRHIFKTILEIPELNKDARLEILRNLLQGNFRDIPSLITLDDLKHFSQKTEGYVLQDLIDLAEKTLFECWKRVGDEKLPEVETSDLVKAFEKNIPLSLRDVKLHHDSSLSWADVGGLLKVKEMLTELFRWPSQYPELFEQSPLRHQSGVLLYGSPGTGKTLLAGAMAQECGLKFISIKGPELLSKYIGASEEAVRNLFIRAQSAKPCILFFDEFDSLAPRRGHDSTGVTDRVVNQLLTQLDGVEGLQGVWVLAATSRPDLLDPALLRPGRIDHTVLCTLPTEEDRLSILKVLSRKVELSDDVDLSKIAQKSPGFTGADLQSLLYTAQIMALEEQQGLTETVVDLRESLSVPVTQKLELAPVITQHHLETSLKNTRPSLSPAEKAKYDIIYQKFEKSRSGSLKNKSKVERMVQRATLA